MIIMPKVYDLEGKEVEEVKLPKVFSYAYRPDIIKKAVLASQANRRQPYGLDPLAGKRTSAHYHGKRKYRWTMMNKEMARISRIHGKVGYLNFVARFVPQATKGRRAHGPKAEKIWSQKINDKERKTAIKSALAATANMELVKNRGHKIQNQMLPIIIVDSAEDIKKTKDVRNFLEKIGLKSELERCAIKKVRAGKGKMRGRKYTKKKGPLIVTSKNCSLLKAARNIAGVDAVAVNNVNSELLAPGTHAGRLLIITKSALNKLE